MLLKLKRSLCLFLPRKSLKERKEDEIVYAIIAKENKDPAMISPLEVPQEVTKLPFDFWDIALKDLTHELPPVRNVQHAIDLLPCSHYLIYLPYEFDRLPVCFTYTRWAKNS